MKLRTLATLAVLASGVICVSAGAPTATPAVKPVFRTGGSAVDGYRIVFSSNRDGQTRAYSMLPDGARLTPLLKSHLLVPQVVSGDGRVVVYRDERHSLAYGTLYASRASGTRLRRLFPGDTPALTRDGRLLAYWKVLKEEIWIVGTNGRGRRLLTREEAPPFPDWSPSGRALVYVHGISERRHGIVLQPLHGKRRVLARVRSDDCPCDSDSAPRWSPDGRWIAYRGGDGLYLVRPNGTRRHRLVHGSLGTFAWSPDGKRLAFVAGNPGYVGVIGSDGGTPKRLRLGTLSPSAVKWSPDARELLLSGSESRDPSQIWAVGSDGSGLRRLTSAGDNSLIGWTRLAPVLPEAPPLPPSERVLGADTVATLKPVGSLSADGLRVAFVSMATASDCDHVVVWAPGDASVQRFAPLPSPCGEFDERLLDVELAGSRVAWQSHRESNGECAFALRSATVADPLPLRLNDTDLGSYGDWCHSRDYYHLRGNGDLLVFDDYWFSGRSRLVRVGVGGETCQAGDQNVASICATLRRDAHVVPVKSVSGGLIAVGERGVVTVLDQRGTLVRRLAFTPADVNAAVLDGGRLIVSRFGVLEVYDVATGALELTRPVPGGNRLADVDGGIAVLIRGGSVTLLWLGDGHSLTLTPGQGPVLADLEPAGLYYSYATGDGGGRVVFVQRSELSRQLGGLR